MPNSKRIILKNEKALFWKKYSIQQMDVESTP